MILSLLRRKDILIFFIIFQKVLGFLTLTTLKCFKKAIFTFALATVLLIIFAEEYDKERRLKLIKHINVSKLLI